MASSNDIIRNISRISKKYKNESENKVFHIINNLQNYQKINSDKWKQILVLSIKMGYLSVIKMCLLNLNTEDFNDPIFVEDIIQLIVQRGILAWQIFTLIYPIIPDNINYNSDSLNKDETFILEAIDRKQLQIVDYILNKNNITCIKTSISFALSKACLQGDIKMVTLLHHYGADINYEDGWPLYMAQISGSTKIVKYLLKNGAHKYQLSIKASVVNDNLKLVKLTINENDFSEEDIQEAFNDCLMSYKPTILDFLLHQIVPKITNQIISLLCLEDKQKSLRWLYDNHLLDGQPIFDIIHNNKSIWKYRKTFRELSYQILNL
jgi:hypothetical protein